MEREKDSDHQQLQLLHWLAHLHPGSSTVVEMLHRHSLLATFAFSSAHIQAYEHAVVKVARSSRGGSQGTEASRRGGEFGTFGALTTLLTWIIPYFH